MANPKKIVEEYFDAIPKRDFDKVRKLIHPNYIYAGGDGQHHEGADAAIEIGEIYTTAFPDLNIEFKHMHVAGNIVVTEFIAHGTHKGELFGIAPTGKKVKTPVCNVIEVRDGKVFTEREYFDSVVLLKQLGVDVLKPKAMA